MKMRPFAKISSLIAIAALAVTGLAASPAQADGPTVPVPNKTITGASVGIQLFLWNWDSIAKECTNVLGPEGIDWVQISPPQEHINGSTWWVHYQPVSYKLDSDLGTRAQFINMVHACNTAGVQIIADAVINHMANSAGSGYAGSQFSKYNYPGIYNESDFHANLDPSDPHYCADSISDYSDPWQVTNCELSGLPDLATEKTNVRQTIANYLNDLIDIGVAGFRVDAAKHIGAEDLAAIKSLLHPVNGQAPWFGSEVIGSADENMPFTSFSDVWAWQMPTDLANNLPTGMAGIYADPSMWTGTFNDSAHTITMVSNHDTEHHGGALTYRDGLTYQLASILMLSNSFGKPELYSGYAFSDDGNGSPNYKAGTEDYANVVCPAGTKASKPQASYVDGTYICMDRWTAIKGMIAWRDAVGANTVETKAKYTHIPANGMGRILQYNRGIGFIAMNPTAKALKTVLAVNEPKGTYCDVISGGNKPVTSKKKCVGTTITVSATGRATVTVPAKSAIAIVKASWAKIK
jgi:alpha-amylase